MNKYSDWFKVDLHIHTDFSKKTKTNDYQGNFDISGLKNKLIENDVKLFSLTDHNIINTDAYKNYYYVYQEGDPKLLIGCEFDIEVPESGKNITYHSVIVFDNDTVEDIELISKKIEDLFVLKGLSLTERKIIIDDLYDLFSGYNFFFIPHAGNTKSIIDPYIEYDLKLCQQMVLLMPSAFEKVKESVRQTYNDGFDKLKEYDFQNRGDIPYINFSDNHNCNKYPCTNKDGDAHEFYCIKGQPTYESIRFAFIDPISRIKKYDEVEVLKRFDNFLHSIVLQNNSFIQDSTLFFSPNLNVIIGGRSSGKSLLFNILGKKIGNAKNNLSKYEIEISDFKIKSFLDSDYKPSIGYNVQDVIYINQGDIVNYFENNSLKDLIKESGKTEEYKIALEFFKEKKRNLTTSIEELVNVYAELFDSINSNFTFHNKDVDSLFDSSYFFKPIEQVEDKSYSFQNSFDIVQNLLENIEKFKTDENWNLTPEDLILINAFKELVELKKSSFQSYKSLHLNKKSFIDSVNNILRSKNSTLDLKGREKEASNNRLETLKNQIFELLKTSLRVEQHCSVIENYKYNFSQEIVIDENVSVVIEIENKEDIKSKLFEGLLINSTNVSLFQALVQLSTNVIKIRNLSDNSVDNFRKKIGTQLKVIYDYFDKPIEYLKYSEESSSKNNSPGFNSEKYLETILKKGNSKIVFIDQPEDNLGNKFITDNLINLLRELKFKKQIFLVTHNPSIVVYGDAECIIMSTNNENKIEYQQFVLEDKTHQKEICNVLDGGQYIFEQRARKYNIKKLAQ
jgi:predicted ATPase